MYRLLLASACMLAISNNALAETKQLQDVVVTAEKTSITASNAEEAEEKINDIPGGADVVKAEEFEDSRATTIKDMLDYTPGVFSQSRAGAESRLSIRGSGLSRTFHLRGIKLLQDGVPINFADGAGDFQDIDPLAYDHVEVYKGANALRYGSSTLGGAINFVTPTGYDASPLKVRLEAGSYNFLRDAVSSGSVIGDSDYFASISNLNFDGYRAQSEQLDTKINANFGHKFSDSLETRFYITHANVNQELPGSLTKAQLRADPSQAAAGNLLLDQQRDFTITRLANKTTWRGEDTEVSGGLYTVYKDMYHPINTLVDQQFNDYGAFANTTLYFEDNELTLGANYSIGRVDARNYVNNRGSYGALTNKTDQRSQNVELYGENRYSAWDDIDLIAGGQLTYAHRNYQDKFLGDGDRSGEKTYTGFSPKIGVMWDAAEDVKVFSNLSMSYEPPTFSELTQNIAGASGLIDIEAQKSVTFEIGTRGQSGRFNWDASVYRAWLKDELFTYSLGGAATGVLNANRTIHQGLELAAGMDIAEDFSTRVAYALNDFYFDGDTQFGNNQIPGIPQHYIRAEVRYDGPGGFYVAPNTEIVPTGYYVDMANTLETSSYAIFGVKAGYDVTENVSMFIDARNLLDKTYAATTGVITTPTPANSAQFIPGDGRTIYAGLTYKW